MNENPRVEQQPDDAVMLRVRSGEVATLAVLFERHHRALFGFFARLTSSRQGAEDLVQDVFLRMLKYRHTFEPGNQFTAWMYQIARNAHIDWIRKRKVETLCEYDREDRLAEVASADPVPDEAIERKQDVSLLRRALDALPVEKRELLILARFQGLKYEEIGRIIDCETNTVKVRVHRAVRDLSRLYRELAGEKAS